MAQARRSFPPEFKVQAVQLVSEQGQSIAEVVRALDASLLRSGKAAFAATGVPAFPGSPHETDYKAR
jgi:transposase-like protein